MDFLDSIFGRKRYPKRETWINGYTFDGGSGFRASRSIRCDTRAGRPATTTGATGKKRRLQYRRQIPWALGEEPAGIRFPVAPSLDEQIQTQRRLDVAAVRAASEVARHGICAACRSAMTSKPTFTTRTRPG